MIKISLITATKNSAATLENCFSSINRQQYMNLEYIVVNGASDQKTTELVGKYEKLISSYIEEPDKGIYHAFNKGLKIASGDIIGFLNADDFFAYDHVLKDVAQCFNDKDIDAVYGNLEYVDYYHTDKVLRKWISGQYQANSFEKGWMPPHPTLYIRREIYEKYGNFNTEFVSAADYELMLRFIHKNKIRLHYLPKVMVKMRAGGMSNRSLYNRIRANREDQKAWSINKLKMPFWLPFRKPLRKIKQFF